MKNHIFHNLLNKFETIPDDSLNSIEGFSDVKNVLSELVTLIDDNQNLNKEEYEKNQKAVQGKFELLKERCSVVLNNGREKLPKEAQGIFTALKGVQKPLDSFLKNLSENKTLNEALSDNTWIIGLFNDVTVKDREDYVPGIFNVDGLSIKEQVDIYNEDKNKAQKAYLENKAKLAGDEFDPQGMIEYKTSLMQDVLDSFEDNTYTFELSRGLSYMHKEMDVRMTSVQVEDLNNSNILSNDFYVEAEKILMDGTTLKSHFVQYQNIALKDQETLHIIEKESRKLLLKPENLGMSNEMLERLQETSLVILSAAKPFDSLIENIENVDDVDNEYHGLYEKAVDIKSKMFNYLQGKEGAESLERKDLDAFLDELKGKMFSTRLFNEKGKLTEDFSILYEIYCDFTEGFNYSTEAVNQTKDLIGKRICEQLTNANEGIINGSGIDEKSLEVAYKQAWNNGFISKEEYDERIYLRMARDPEFNQRQIERAKAALHEFAEGAKLEDPYYLTYNNQGFETTDPSTGKSYTPTDVYRDVYKLLLIGNKIKIQNEKREQLKDGHAKDLNILKNVNQELSSVASGKIPYDVQAEFIHKLSQNLENNEVFKGFQDIKPSDFINMIEGDKNLLYKAEEVINAPKTDMLKDIDDETLSFMIQESGAMNHSNSPSYTLMSDSLKNIFDKNKNPGGASPEDYRDLYEKCSSYVDSHNASPFFDNSKKRFQAALNIMSTLGPKLAKKFPDMAKRIDDDRLVNMARHEGYRKKEGNIASNWIKNISSKMNEKGLTFDQLPKDRQKEFIDKLEIATQSRTLHIRIRDLPKLSVGKCDLSRRNEILEKVSLPDDISNRLMKGLSSNFNATISNVVGGPKPQNEMEKTKSENVNML